MNNIPFFHEKIPSLTTKQMREVDRAMIEDYNILLIQMMENAGRNLAQLARHRFFNGKMTGKKITVLAGTGGNGGGALVCARHMHNYGAIVTVFITKERKQFTPIPKHQLDIIERMNIPIFSADELHKTNNPDLIIDGIIGYSLIGAPRGSAATMIHWANKTTTPILALDVPSGLDTTSGKVYDPTIKAVATMTLALPKQGLFATNAATNVGEIYLANISIPPELYASPSLNIDVNSIFDESDIVRIS